ncbi:MAG: succinate dehydrogenase [Rubricoccaceae bacterium]|nr:succinate dehydrogenase [Rubricoccaceae bacterium]
MSKQYGRSSRSSAFQWFAHRITGTFLIFLLITHFWVQHYDRTTASISHSVITSEEADRGVMPEYTDEANEAVRARRSTNDGTDRQPVVPADAARSAQPSSQEATPYEVLMLRLGDPVYAVLWKGFNLLFLLFALHHGFYGVTNIISDYVRNDMIRLVAISLTWLIALVLFVVGSYSVIVAGLNI